MLHAILTCFGIITIVSIITVIIILKLYDPR